MAGIERLSSSIRETVFALREGKQGLDLSAGLPVVYNVAKHAGKHLVVRVAVLRRPLVVEGVD